MLKPTQDYLLIEPIARSQSTVLQVVSHEKHCLGRIIAAGPGKYDKKGRIQPLDAKIGQTVAFGNGDFDFYPKHYDTPEGPCYRIIQEADICGILEDDLQYYSLMADEIE